MEIENRLAIKEEMLNKMKEKEEQLANLEMPEASKIEVPEEAYMERQPSKVVLGIQSDYQNFIEF